MRRTVIGVFILCFLGLTTAVYLLAPRVVDEAIIVNSERLAIHWLEKLEQEFDLPGDLNKKHLETEARPLRLLTAGITPEISEKAVFSIFDPTLFRDSQDLGFIQSFVVYNQAGERLISGGHQSGIGVNDRAYRNLFRDSVRSQEIRTAQFHITRSGKFVHFLKGWEKFKSHPGCTHLITVMVPLKKHGDVAGVARIEVIPTEMLEYIEILVQRIASIAAGGLAILALIVLYILNRWDGERAKVNKKVEYLAKYDPLTGALNRHAVLDFFKSYHECNEVKPFTMWAFDVDNFKQINDTYGHHTGDQVLRKLSSRLINAFPEDTLFCRVSGDEFIAIIQSKVSDEKITQISDLIINSTTAPIFVNQKKLSSSVSFGIASYPKDSTDANEVPVFADMALYRAKENQKACWYRHGQTVSDQISRERRLRTDLEKALKSGNLELHYQPQVDIQKGKITGVEALLRWHHPQMGFIAPSEFIAVAERYNLITEIDCYVLDKACKQAKKWDPQITVSVNISPIHLENGSLIKAVENALEGSGLEPNRLELEITENVLLKKAHSIGKIFQDLRNIGVKIALDDFGTGYSNLSYISQMPITKLKIDRSFVAKINERPAHRTIVKAILYIGRELNIEVLAEGVESFEELNLLGEYQCNSVQGFLYGKPAKDPFAANEGNLEKTLNQLETAFSSPMLKASA